MRKIDLLFAEYAESHRHKTNKLIHWVCVPLIFWSIIGLISLVPSPHFYIQNFGFISLVSVIIITLVSLFYLSLSWRIAIIMLFLIFGLEYTIYRVNIMSGNPWLIYFSVFVLAWIGQFFGHKIEGKKPSFLKDLQFLLIGPIWLLHFVIKKLKLRY